MNTAQKPPQYPIVLAGLKPFRTALLFVGVCTLALTSGGAPLFYDDFENGLGQWVGKSSTSGSALIVTDPLNSGHGKVLKFTGLTVAGDIFSRASFSIRGPFRIAFDYLGDPSLGVGFLGVSYTIPPYIGEGYDNFWYAASRPNPTAIIMLVNDGTWHHYDIQVDGTTLTQPVHLMAEDWSGDGGAAGNSFFDNISLTLVPEPNLPPQVSCPAAAAVECGAPVEVTVSVSDPDGDALTVLWTVNGDAVQTNSLPGSNPHTASAISFSAELPLGTNIVGVLVTDTATNTASCSTMITVVDPTPPVIVSAAANPSVLWPPNHQMVPVNVGALVNDACGPVVWKIIGVRGNESVKRPAHGNTAADWVITGDHTVNLRAERSGTSAGRMYFILIQAMDGSGNLSEPKIVPVTVPKSRGK